MRDRPYARVYHELADEYQQMYDSADLAGYVRLLVAADQAWPSKARWAGYVDDLTMARLVSTGLVIADGARFDIKGLAKERAARSLSASHAASARWRIADGNARNMPSQAKPSLAKPSQAKPSQAKREDDCVDLYYTLTTRTPSKTVMEWLDRLESDHGRIRLAEQMTTAWTADPNLRDFLGRVEASCVSVSRAAAKDADAKRARAEAEYRRSLREGRDAMTPEEKARADDAMRQVGDIVKGIA